MAVDLIVDNLYEIEESVLQLGKWCMKLWLSHTEQSMRKTNPEYFL